MMRLWRCLTALVLALLLTRSGGAAGTAGFSDVPESHWAAQSIRRCAQTGLLQGVGGGRVGLGRTMTRAAYATALCRLMGWELATPETAGVWSAVAYWAAQELVQRLGVPVGIGGCNYGGSSVSCWMPETKPVQPLRRALDSWER